MSVVLEEFYNIFGPELKAVTGEPKRIEEVLQKVKNLVVRIKSVSSCRFGGLIRSYFVVAFV